MPFAGINISLEVNADSAAGALLESRLRLAVLRGCGLRRWESVAQGAQVAVANKQGWGEPLPSFLLPSWQRQPLLSGRDSVNVRYGFSRRGLQV